MIQLLLVDDEAKTRNGLLKHVDWEKLGIDMVQTAQSAQEALALCEEYQPDILISDIRMRKMNGLEMSSILSQKYPSCKIIIISGYADKEYLKAAIELGSISYVEKPIDLQELENALKKTVKVILEDRKSIQNSERLLQNQEFLKRETFLSLLNHQKGSELIDIHELLPQEYKQFRVCVVRFCEPVLRTVQMKKTFLQSLELEQFFRAGGFVHSEFTDNRHMVLLLCGERSLISDESRIVEQLTEICQKPCDESKIFLSWGELVDAPEQISLSYHHAQTVEKAIFYKGYSNVEFFQEREEKPVVLEQDYVGRLKNFLIRGDEEAAEHEIQNLTQAFYDMHVESSAYVLSLYFELGKAIISEFGRLFLESEEKRTEKYQTSIQTIENLDTITEIEAYLISQIRELFTLAKKDRSNSFMIMKVKKFINEHYQQRDISVKQIAAELYITPTYLSSLFKRKTGNTIGEYLTTVRIEESKKLLLDPRMKTYEVALAVGYEDANYFTKIFKKNLGVTPSEYRERKGL